MTFDLERKSPARAKKRVALTLACTAVAVLLAACGGGDDAPAPAAPTASVQLSGTAATGLALADSQVEIKCATGSGSTTTNASGAYTASIAGAALPCMIRVTGTSGGVAIVLHSVAEAGSTASGVTSATANVTPLTEIIVAQLAANLPTVMFDSFGSGTTVTSAQLTAATTAVLTTLRDAAGIDLGSIDPFKAALVAATIANPTGGNNYDKLLDALGVKVSVEALPIIVSQIASAATTGSQAALTDVMTGVAAGSLENCPVAISGKYRTIDYTGDTQVHFIDFKAKTLLTDGSSVPETIVPSTTQACQFSVNSTVIVIGPQGAGALYSADMTGWVFPVQAHSLASVTGTWAFVESGLNESNAGEHFIGKIDIAADGAAKVCDYDVMSGIASFTTCNEDTDEGISVKAASDGSFDLLYGTEAGKLYGYRAPNGSLSLFGSNNPSGSDASNALRTSIVMVRPVVLALPAVGEVTKYWDVSLSSPSAGVLQADPFLADSTTVTAVDAATGSVTRTRTGDGRVDVMQFNKPIDGLRYREASSGISSTYQMQVPTLGLSVTIDNMPGHFWAISVRRP